MKKGTFYPVVIPTTVFPQKGQKEENIPYTRNITVKYSYERVKSYQQTKKPKSTKLGKTPTFGYKITFLYNLGIHLKEESNL